MMNGAVCPYQFRHNRKIPGGWKDNENGSLGIINTPTNSNPLILSHNLKKKQNSNHDWLDYIGLRKMKDWKTVFILCFPKALGSEILRINERDASRDHRQLRGVG